MSAGKEWDSETAAPVYVYESKVHCANVLLSLEEQRQQGILCDVTILVEGTEVRAHRAVLAASSRYFLQVLLGHNRSPGEAELIINLPDQVTAKGFAPLLQFAYTARLFLSQQNIHEVILCADFLGVHNLEDTCFVFLQEQLQNDSQQASSGKGTYDDDNMAEDTVLSDKVSLDDSAKTRQQINNVANTSTLLADFPQCSKSRMYQYQICDNKHNGENHHGSNDIVLSDHTSINPLSLQLADNSAAPQTLLTPSRIKEETFVSEEGGDEKTGSNPELCTEEVLEMELEVEGVPIAAEHLPNQESPPSCQRSYLQSSGLDLSNIPSTAIEQLLTNRLSLNHYRESVKNSHQSKRDSLSQVDLKTGAAHVIPAALTDISRKMESSVSKISASKHEGELDRCSVIFSFSGGEAHMLSHSYMDEKFREKVSTLMQIEPNSSSQLCLTNSCPTSIKTSADSPATFKPCTQTKSFRYSFSYPEDTTSGSSPFSLPQLGFYSSSHSSSISGLPYCMAGVLEQRDPHGSEVVFSQGCTKIKNEEEFAASGGSSSDESSSFSEGDSESGISRFSGPEEDFLWKQSSP